MTHAAAGAGARAPRFSELLQQRAFIRFWFTRLLATTGNQMLMVAVGWQMYELTGQAWDLGLVGLYQFLPALLLTLVAGHVADRVHRARIVAACVLAQGLVAALLVLATLGGWVSRDWLLGLSVLLGTARLPDAGAAGPDAGAGAAAHAAARDGVFLGGHAGRHHRRPGPGRGDLVAGATAVYLCCLILFVLGIVLILRVHYDHEPPPRGRCRWPR
jgi:MFS-type transporter involved in bile tolerance (Atg22 family)